ncbi:MAG: heme exporter protein CcmD [Pseudomonadota bacterium]
MGEHAVFIWPAYGVAAVILIGLLVASLTSLRRRRAELARLEQERTGENGR